jgi:hypothetical protein
VGDSTGIRASPRGQWTPHPAADDEPATIASSATPSAPHRFSLRLRAVVADGPTRPTDGDRVSDPTPLERAFRAVAMQAVRAVSGTHEPPSLLGIMPRIAPRPVLLIAGGVGAPTEIPANRAYRDAGGPTTQLWELPDTGHTAGLRTHPTEYERRTTAFLDRTLELEQTP